MPIEYICFDIGGVANISLKPEEVLAETRVLFGDDYSINDFVTAIHAHYEGKNWWRDLQNGKVSAEEYLSAVLRSSNLDDSAENSQKLRHSLVAWCGVAYQPTINLVERLNKLGYYTSVLSNNNTIMYDIPSAEIKNRVHLSLSSHLIGFSKPEEEAYKKLLSATGARPEEMIFVDDKSKNITTAKELGIKGFKFRSREITMSESLEEFVHFLRSEGVEV
ncbi:MAG: HAD-IA family hydrolase [Nanoarchaeota archaeon]|nr:HAD-IA family hydrolase [Nanoarchaeota archaeon]MBU1644286.1 HAD-IA family hydrolase [Nanoarchaeota archaeon]MBU1977258.1 HAD-IA family hydrolase [Nanoarchaeota archaeon]